MLHYGDLVDVVAVGEEEEEEGLGEQSWAMMV